MVLLAVGIWEPYQVQSTIYMTEDLSRGLEKIPIVVVLSDYPLPPFQYINESMVHDQASVFASLSTLRKGSYCLYPLGDCLTTACSCECAKTANKGGLAYKAGRLLKDSFLQQWISDVSQHE